MILVVGLSPALQRLCFFEELVPGEVNRARRVQASAGGKAVNVSRALAILGSPVCLVQALGGESGRQVAGVLEEAGVSHETVWDDRAVTRTCSTLITARHQVTELVEESPPMSRPVLKEITRRLHDRLHGARALCLSGSLPPGVPVGWYADLVRTAQSRQVPVLVDAQGPVLRTAIEAGPWLVKPNLQETRQAFGLEKTGSGDQDIRAAAAALRGAGSEWAVVSRGAEGAWLSGPLPPDWSACPPSVEVLNPIGAGDTLTAGLLHACFHEKRPMPEALRFAIACAAASCESLKNATFEPSRAALLEPEVQMTAQQ